MRKLSAAVCVLSAAVLCQTAIQALILVPRVGAQFPIEKFFQLVHELDRASKTIRKRRITSRNIRSSRFCALTGATLYPRLLA